MNHLSKKLSAAFSVMSLFGATMLANAKTENSRDYISGSSSIKEQMSNLYGLASMCTPNDEECCKKYPEDSACKKP